MRMFVLVATMAGTASRQSRHPRKLYEKACEPCAAAAACFNDGECAGCGAGPSCVEFASQCSGCADAAGCRACFEDPCEPCQPAAECFTGYCAPCGGTSSCSGACAACEGSEACAACFQDTAVGDDLRPTEPPSGTRPTLACTNGEFDEDLQRICPKMESIDECCSFIETQSSENSEVCSVETSTRVSVRVINTDDNVDLSDRADQVLADRTDEYRKVGSTRQVKMQIRPFNPLEQCTSHCK